MINSNAKLVLKLVSTRLEVKHGRNATTNSRLHN